MRDTNDWRVNGAGCFSEIDAKAPSVASDALKEYEWCGSSSEGATCVVGDLSGVSEGSYDAPAKWANDAMNNLVDAYNDANSMLMILGNENRALIEKVNNLREQVAELMDDSRELAELKRKLREMVR